MLQRREATNSPTRLWHLCLNHSKDQDGTIIQRTNEDMCLRGEPTAVTLPSQHNPWLHPAELSLYTQVIVVLTPHKGNFSLQQVETVIGNLKPSKYIFTKPSPKECSYKSLFTRENQCSLLKGGHKNFQRQRIREFVLRSCLIDVRNYPHSYKMIG